MAQQNIVFIVGAGASVGAGVPVMARFIEVMYDLFGSKDDHSGEYSTVFAAMSELRKVYANSFVDLNNLESVLSAFDMAQHVQSLGSFSKVDVAELYYKFVSMIVKTIELRTIFERSATNRLISEGSYLELVGQVIDGWEDKNRHADFITFNYDIALDSALIHTRRYRKAQQNLPNYGFGEQSDLPMLMKLHGSINWSASDDRIEPYSFLPDDFIRSGQRNSLTYRTTREGNSYVKRVSFSTRTDMSSILIVPPSYSKMYVNADLRSVWINAARSISRADVIVFIGYSVPLSDLMFRYLFSVATIDNDLIRRIIVLNPDKELHDTYKQFLGVNTSSRVDYIVDYFNDDGVNRMLKCIDLAFKT